jgi:aminopeptidase N
VRSYLRRHAWGNATSDDFFQALAATDAALPSAVRSFTRQGGIPRLQVRLLCDDGPPRLQLAQSRLVPIGATASPPQTWQLPLRVRTPAGSTRLLMHTPDAVLPLPDTTCPAWVQANADGLGYWRAAYAGNGLLQLAGAPGLSVAEWLALLDDAIGLHDAGDIDTRQALAMVRAAAAHPSGEVAQAAAGLLQHLRPLFQPAHQAAYGAHWQAAFGDRARRLGWLPQPADSADDRLLRPLLLPLVSTLGDDSALRREALGLAWLADHSRLPADLRQPVLAAAAAADGPDSGAPLLEALANALRASTLRTERGDLLAALGHFRQPELAAHARALLLEPRLDLRDSLWPLLSAQADDTTNRAAALDFVLANLPVLAPRLGQDDLAYLPSLFRRGCSDDEARRLDAGLRTRMATVTGGRLSLTRALESVRMCSAWRNRQSSNIE